MENNYEDSIKSYSTSNLTAYLLGKHSSANLSLRYQP